MIYLYVAPIISMDKNGKYKKITALVATTRYPVDYSVLKEIDSNFSLGWFSLISNTNDPVFEGCGISTHDAGDYIIKL